MSEHKKENGQENQSKEKSKDKEPSLTDYAARRLGYKKGKLPKDWCRVIIKS